MRYVLGCAAGGKALSAIFLLLAAGSTGRALAETELKATSLSISGIESKFIINYRWELDQSDHGFVKTDSNTPTRTTSTQINLLKLGLKGKVADNFEYYVRYDFVKPSKGKDGLDYAKVTWWATPSLGLTFGKDRVNQAGWDPKEGSVFRLTASPYVDLAGKSTGQPFASEAPVFSAQYKLGDPGVITIQLTDDVVKSSAAGVTSRAQFNKENIQPATTFEYQSQFGAIAPLLQVGSYDINHSKFYVVGLKADVAEVHTFVDYVIDNKSVQITADEKDMTVITSATWHIDYNVSQVARPFLKVISYNVKDAKTDVKGNVGFDPTKKTESAFESGAITDNALVFTIGSWLLPVGDKFRPYLAYTSKTSNFLKGSSVEETEGKTEGHIRFGVAGEF